MKATIIQVPYDSGHYGKRMGRGPLHLVDSGIVMRLESAGQDVELVPIRLSQDFATEIGAAVEIQSLVAQSVASARSKGRLPLVLAGNCNTAIGTVSAVGPTNTGVVWLDAHGDFNTPETSISGFFDGMALSILTGHCWQSLAAQIAGFSPVPETNVALVAARDFDAEEDRLLKNSSIAHVTAGAIREEGILPSLGQFLDDLIHRVSQVYLHVDLDVLDASDAKVNRFSSPGGLSVVEVVQIVEAVGDRLTIAAAAFTAYDPQYDLENRTLEAAESIVDAILASAASSLD